MIRAQLEKWAVLWSQKNDLDGERSWLVGDSDLITRTELFDTRSQARDFIRLNYGFIRGRKDLQIEPHGWRMPKPVKVTLTIELAS